MLTHYLCRRSTKAAWDFVSQFIIHKKVDYINCIFKIITFSRNLKKQNTNPSFNIEMLSEKFPHSVLLLPKKTFLRIYRLDSMSSQLQPFVVSVPQLSH